MKESKVGRTRVLLLIERAFQTIVASSIMNFGSKHVQLTFGPQIRRDYPLNLSILLSGGKETNQDSLSSGERSGMRPR